MNNNETTKIMKFKHNEIKAQWNWNNQMPSRKHLQISENFASFKCKKGNGRNC